MGHLRLLVADDHEIVRKGICALLQAHPGWEIVAQARNGLEAAQAAEQFKPDVAVIDIAMPCLNGFEAARQIVKDSPETGVLLVTMHEVRDLARMSLRAGALGCILKSDAASDLAAAVSAVSEGKQFFSKKVQDLFLDESAAETDVDFHDDVNMRPLSKRQKEIIQLVAEGKTTSQVADILNLSPGTVVKHRADILRRLNLHTMNEVVEYALQKNIVKKSS